MPSRLSVAVVDAVVVVVDDGDVDDEYDDDDALDDDDDDDMFSVSRPRLVLSATFLAPNLQRLLYNTS